MSTDSAVVDGSVVVVSAVAVDTGIVVAMVSRGAKTSVVLGSAAAVLAHATAKTAVAAARIIVWTMGRTLPRKHNCLPVDSLGASIGGSIYAG